MDDSAGASGDYRKSDDYRRRTAKDKPLVMSPHALHPDRGTSVRPGLGAAAALLGTPVACWALHRIAGRRWDAVRLVASVLCMGQALAHPYARNQRWFATSRQDLPNGIAENVILSSFVGYLCYDQWVLGTRNIWIVLHHLFTAGVYSVCTLTGRALHMGRFILINEAVSGINALHRLGLLSGRTVRSTLPQPTPLLMAPLAVAANAPALMWMQSYDTVMTALYLALRLPLHGAAGLVTTKQGYFEFKILAPLLMCLDVFFGAQHAMKLLS